RRLRGGVPASGCRRMNRAITVLLVAFGLSVALTLVSERLARRFGLVARPVADRWHRQTIPMLGGIAIVVGTLVPAVVVARTSALRLVFFVWEGDLAGALVTVAFIGAVGGFLTRNFPPAKIFMGDTGSLFLGFFLAGLSLVADQSPYSRGVAAVLIIPVLLLSIPIFDTAFVTVTRIMTGRRVGVGGRDHTSHRLVAIGLSERQPVL